MTNNKRGIDINPLNSIGAILVLVGILLLLYFVAKGVFTLLYYASPLLLIGALFLNYKVVLGYVQMVFKQLRTNPIVGIGVVLLTVFLFPVVFAFLFGKAYLYRKLDQFAGKVKEKTQGEFTEFEEIEDLDESPRMQLPEVEIKRPQKERVEKHNKSEYDDLFEDV